jgi:hypothetical protein
VRERLEKTGVDIVKSVYSDKQRDLCKERESWVVRFIKEQRTNLIMF